MKISKLFHWLYAILMLLPAFFVGGRMLYTIFNKNAKDSYSGISDFEYTEINNLVINDRYNFNTQNNVASASGSSTLIQFSNLENLHTSQPLVIPYFDTYHYFRYYWESNGTPNIIYFYSDDLVTSYGVSMRNFTLEFDFTLDSFETNNLSNLSFLRLIGYEDYDDLDNVFNYSMSQLNELPLFSWAQDSFIVQPFTYITGLFGMPSDSPVLTLLSYWCSISLIWLTFDLLMYVPLLVHRWIDKGVLE